ncbi:hypothetical protein PCASD_11989 [Puccinia coronata f. sp. avenae]|uniref:Uncharacterized protein n=1 Tax=Puccinia coronata f. sp. avenae TaxID=200324 RepID=A0A2N5UA74_9BASI|nr:hypothetical protein PCASD_11989 [Puccinia coronata f. sp. avenae]
MFNDTQRSTRTQQYTDRSPLSGTTRLELLGGNPPPHLYFAMETATIAGAHFRSKVVRNVAGILGVWLQDDQANQGNAWLLENNPSSVGGTSPDTSFVMYLSAWSTEEEEFIDQQIARIKKDRPKAKGQVPFAYLRSLLIDTTDASKNKTEELLPNPEDLALSNDDNQSHSEISVGNGGGEESEGGESNVGDGAGKESEGGGQ